MSTDTENKAHKIKKELFLELSEMYTVGEQHEDYMFIQQLPTDDEGKYQHESYVWLHMPTKTFYKGTATRSGSYFDEYHWQYNEDEEDMITLSKVKMVPIQAFVWRTIK